jgi:hypothetical protein
MAGGAPGAPGAKSGDIRGVDIRKIDKDVSSESSKSLIERINKHIAAYIDHLPDDYISDSDTILNHALAAALMAEGSRFPVDSAHWDLNTYPPRVLGFGIMDLGPAPPASPASAPPPGMM